MAAQGERRLQDTPASYRCNAQTRVRLARALQSRSRCLIQRDPHGLRYTLDSDKVKTNTRGWAAVSSLASSSPMPSGRLHG
jgi:predicted ABC-type transport system involved in lysophospholipase L1 biosynthesis ATPase subunit